MTEGDILMVMNLAGCSRENAIASLETHKDVVDAVDSLINVTPSRGGLIKKEKDEKQLFFDKIRVVTTELNTSIEKGLVKREPTCEGPHEHEESIDLPCLHEETVQQSNCSQGYHPPSPELKAETREIVYQTQ
jgi:hypothetical protein